MVLLLKKQRAAVGELERGVNAVDVEGWMVPCSLSPSPKMARHTTHSLPVPVPACLASATRYLCDPQSDSLVVVHCVSL